MLLLLSSLEAAIHSCKRICKSFSQRNYVAHADKSHEGLETLGRRLLNSIISKPSKQLAFSSASWSTWTRSQKYDLSLNAKVHVMA